MGFSKPSGGVLVKLCCVLVKLNMATPRGAYLIGLAGLAVALVIVLCGKTRFGAGGGGHIRLHSVKGGLLGASIGIFIVGATKSE